MSDELTENERRMADALGRVYQDSLTLWVKHIGNDIPATSEAADLIDAIRTHVRVGLGAET